jgi:hypothetical protein
VYVNQDVGVSSMDYIFLKELPTDAKIQILKGLGYDSDGTYVLKNNIKYKDKYLDMEVTLENMLILQGSTVIIDNNPVSIAAYLEEYGEHVGL